MNLDEHPLTVRRRRLIEAIESRLIDSLQRALGSENLSTLTQLLQQSDMDLVAPRLTDILASFISKCIEENDMHEHTHTHHWEKAARLLRFIVWGNVLEPKASWRRTAEKILSWELSGEARATLVHPWVVERVWSRATVLAGLHASETALLLAVLRVTGRLLPEIGRSKCVQLMGFVFRSHEHLLYMPATETSSLAGLSLNHNHNHELMNVHALNHNHNHELMNVHAPLPTVRIDIQLERFLTQFAHRLDMQELVDILMFRRQCSSSLSSSSTVSVETKRLNSTVPMSIFFGILSGQDEPSLDLVLHSAPRQSSVLDNKSIATAQEDSKLIHLLDLLLDYDRDIESPPLTRPEHLKRISLGGLPPTFTPWLISGGWTLSLIQWHYWSRHPTLFWAMCQRFGAPRRQQVNQITEEWPSVAVSMLGLQRVHMEPNKRKTFKNNISLGDPHVLATGSLWYSMAACWLNHLGYLGLCPLKLPRKEQENKGTTTVTCECVYCEVFRAGWQRAYWHVEAFVQRASTNPFPSELAHIVWNFLLYDPRPFILAIF